LTVSNQNAGIDRRSCELAWAKIVVHWAANLQPVGDQCLKNEIKHFAKAARELQEELQAIPCDCLDCQRKIPSVGVGPHVLKVM
jgi:hypothetical protein